MPIHRCFKDKFRCWIAKPSTVTMLITFVITLLLLLKFQYGFLGEHINRVHFMRRAVVDSSGIVPILLFSSLNGYIPAVVLSFAVFVCTSIVAGDFAFVVFVFMIASLISYMPVFRFWYRSLWKTLGAIMHFTLILGVGWGIVMNIVREIPILPIDLFVWFVSAFPYSCCVGIFCYCFFNFVPEKIRNLFWAGQYYSQENEQFSNLLYRGKVSRLKTRISWIIVTEAIMLSFCAAIFGNIMLMSISRMHHIVIIQNYLSFDLKLILLLLNVSIPIALFANNTAQKSLAMPIIMMERAMSDFTRGLTGTQNDTNAVLDIHLLHIKTGDEIEDLYNSLKTTARTLSAYIEDMQREQQLKDDLKIAQAANKAKTTFLSNMSHEIRTPINAVLGFDEMILREATDPVILGYAEDIHNSSKTLLSLINDILDFSKIEAGKMEIIPVQYELASTLNDVVNMIQKRAEDKHLQFVVNVEPTIPHILFGDEVRLKQCILNILTNAVKYTHEGSVTMNVSHTKKDDNTISLFVQVIDTGIGIKEADLAKLYTAFERIEEKRNRTIEGTGLGMSIVQQLLEMMGSRLVVKSEYGKGSDFSFTVDQHVTNWEPINDFVHSYQQSIDDVGNHYRETFVAPDAHILVVDDTPLNLKVVQGLLKQTQLKIDTAKSGQVTLELVQKNKYDVILLDHRMPGMDGIETLQKMQTLSGNLNADVPIIALTANAISGAREFYLDAGFTDYLSKPIDDKKLEKLLRKYIPADKVQLTAAPTDTDEASASADAAAAFPPIDGVDIAAALKNCGSAEVLRDAFQSFYDSIAEKSAQIADYAAQQDWKNYTVLVHALKSSARLIGATELSEQAKYLEACGDKAPMEQDAAHEIAAKTPALLELYQSYVQKLAPVAPASQNAATKPEMSAVDFEQALIALKECVSAFDFGTADQIVAEVERYTVPAACASQWQSVKHAIANVDQAAAMAALETLPPAENL